VSTAAHNARSRLLIAVVAVLLSLAIYLPAEARATSFHDFYRHFVHPFGSIVLSWCILGLCVIALSASWPLLLGGSWLRRITVFGVSIVPLLILARYFVWLVHQWTAR
jgi:hypothetical protein